MVIKYQFKNPIRLIELFAGYGSQALALRYLGIPFEHHFVCEFDKYAIQSYNDIHGTDFEVSDIRDVHADDLGIVDTDNYKYLLTYSFPCTDLSVAGRRAGMNRGSGTSSSLLWEVERLLNECINLPQYLLMENVPMVISKDNLHNFGQWTAFLSKLGYINYYQVLNSADYGIPQHRERCFMVSILRSENKQFVFPDPVPLKIRLMDMLEDNVDEKYYLTSDKAQKLLYQLRENGDLYTGTETNCITTENRGVGSSSLAGVVKLGYIENGTGNHQSNTVYGVCGISPTLNAADYKAPVKVVTKNPAFTTVQQRVAVGYIENGTGKHQSNTVYSTKGVSPALTTISGGTQQIKILVEPDMDTKLRCIGQMEGGFECANRVYDITGLCPTITTSASGSRAPKICEPNQGKPGLKIKNATKQGYLEANPGDSVDIGGRIDWHRGTVMPGMSKTLTTNGNVGVVCDDWRIRKLTPKECFSLMGVKDADYAKLIVSASQRYKQAGNSIVVNVLMAIFENMFLKKCKSNRLF